MSIETSMIASYAKKVLPLATAKLGDEYFYQSISLCIIDSVYSIGVRYEGVRNVIGRYCAHYGMQHTRCPKHLLPERDKQESVSEFCAKTEKHGPSVMALNIYRNEQRTSPVNGILKADGAYQFGAVLRKHGIEYLQDVEIAINSPKIEKDILAIPGQKSGICLKYFFMLSGSDELIKPDRRVLSFLNSALGRSPGLAEAQKLLTGATGLLLPEFPKLTPRLLDHAIWNYEREKAKRIKFQVGCVSCTK